MTKQEIISRIDSLKIRVKSPGRSYSREQRDEMRIEIENLQIELDKINLVEDLDYINENESKYSTLIEPMGLELKNKIDILSDSIKDERIRFAMKGWFNKFNDKLRSFNTCCQEVNSNSEALTFIKNNQPIPSSNNKRYNSKDEICRSLSKFYRAVNDLLSELKNITREIESLIVFFEKETLNGFVFLKNAVFSEASDFSKGYAIVAQGSNKMYLEHTGDLLKIEAKEELINKIIIPSTNPDLIPFEINENIFDKLMGYKNSKGEVIINPIYKYASPFINGFAKVGIQKKDWPITYGLIDANGTLVLLCDFIELGDVHNEIVIYKKRLYREGYERTSSLNFDMRYTTTNLGLYSGYLKFGELKTAILDEVEKIFEIEKSLADLKTNTEVENENARIKAYKERVEYYLKYVIERKK